MRYKNYRRGKAADTHMHHKVLPRENIAAIMNSTSLDEMLCFVAPYGCGKTLAVMSWLREGGKASAWVRLDEIGGTESALFAGLTVAIKRFAGLSCSTHDVLNDPSFINDPQALLCEAVVTAEETRLERILVLDGFQHIAYADFRYSIKDFLSSLLGRWRVIITSRTELPSVFNDLFLKRHICLISLKELNFSREEMSEFFYINGRTVSQESILQIQEETEGWPSALNAILATSRGGPVSYGAAAARYISDFFEIEIWRPLERDIKDFVLKTSVLDKLTPAACHAVTDLGATRPILRRLFEKGMFIISLDEVNSYRYHKVFRSFLLDKLAESVIDEQALYKSLAWWRLERGEHEQAFTCFFKAGDLHGLDSVFKALDSAAMGLERYLELVGCTTELKVDNLQNYPLIAARIAMIHCAFGNIDEMQRHYNKFIEWIEPGVLPLPPLEYAECIWEAGWMCYLNPAEPVPDNKFEEWFSYAEFDPALKARHHKRIAVYRFPSILRGVRDCTESLDSLAEFTPKSCIYNEEYIWRIDILRAEYHYELENFTLAERIIRQVMVKVESRQLTDLYFVCVVLLVKIIRVKYDAKEIWALISRVEVMIQRNNHSFLLQRFHAFEQRCRLLDGETGQTEVFEKENKAYLEKPYFFMLYRHVALVRAFLSTGDYNEALNILGNIENICQKYNRTMDLIEVDILRSIADFGLGNLDDACRHLTHGLDSASRFGFIRIFSDDAKDIWPVLEIISRQRSDPYVKSVIISCKKTLARSGIRIRQKERATSELTKTELKILKVLSTEMTYNEIALDNNIKLSTVKTHVHSIYSKLDVSSREAAVMTAQGMGILD